MEVAAAALAFAGSQLAKKRVSPDPSLNVSRFNQDIFKMGILVSASLVFGGFLLLNNQANHGEDRDENSLAHLMTLLAADLGLGVTLLLGLLPVIYWKNDDLRNFVFKKHYNDNNNL